MSAATRFACTLVFLGCYLAMVGCSGSADAPPASEIPDIPPSTRSAPGEVDPGGQKSEFVPAQPPG